MLDDMRRLRRFVNLAVSACNLGVDAPELVRQMRRIARATGRDPYTTEDAYDRAIHEADELASFAREEKERGHSYIYEIAIVKLWSMLETYVDGHAYDVLLHHENLRELDAVRNLRGPLLEFATASRDEQAEFLLAELKLAVKATLQRGVGRFEAVLDAVHLGGPVDPHVRRKILELSQVRNVIVHRGGEVDRQLTDRCPWVHHTIGSKLLITARDYAQYGAAVHWYGVEIDGRRYGRGHGEASGDWHGEVQEQMVAVVIDSEGDSEGPAA